MLVEQTVSLHIEFGQKTERIESDAFLFQDVPCDTTRELSCLQSYFFHGLSLTKYPVLSRVDGACGYGNLNAIPQLGTNIAAAANYFWAGGQACGSCYEVGKNIQEIQTTAWQNAYSLTYAFKCLSSECCWPLKVRCSSGSYCRDSSVTLTITDQCPTCDNAMHFDLSMPAFSKISDTAAGKIGIVFRR